MKKRIEVAIGYDDVRFYADGRLSSPAETPQLRVLVCGGRDFEEGALLDAALGAFNIDIIIHGAARGADSLAAVFANKKGIPQLPCPADWGRHGWRAGYIRNLEMLSHKPDIVVAFSGGPGTAHMVCEAMKAGITVYEIRDYNEIGG